MPTRPRKLCGGIIGVSSSSSWRRGAGIGQPLACKLPLFAHPRAIIASLRRRRFGRGEGGRPRALLSMIVCSCWLLPAFNHRVTLFTLS